MSELQHARLIVSRDALLSPTQAARLIGGRDAAAWLERHVRYRYVAGRPRVLWGDVIDASAATPDEAPRRARIRLAEL